MSVCPISYIPTPAEQLAEQLDFISERAKFRLEYPMAQRYIHQYELANPWPYIPQAHNINPLLIDCEKNLNIAMERANNIYFPMNNVQFADFSTQSIAQGYLANIQNNPTSTQCDFQAQYIPSQQNTLNIIAVLNGSSEMPSTFNNPDQHMTFNRVSQDFPLLDALGISRWERLMAPPLIKFNPNESLASLKMKMDVICARIEMNKAFWKRTFDSVLPSASIHLQKHAPYLNERYTNGHSTFPEGLTFDEKRMFLREQQAIGQERQMLQEDNRQRYAVLTQAVPLDNVDLEIPCVPFAGELEENTSNFSQAVKDQECLAYYLNNHAMYPEGSAQRLPVEYLKKNIVGPSGSIAGNLAYFTGSLFSYVKQAGLIKNGANNLPLEMPVNSPEAHADHVVAVLNDSSDLASSSPKSLSAVDFANNSLVATADIINNYPESSSQLNKALGIANLAVENGLLMQAAVESGIPQEVVLQEACTAIYNTGATNLPEIHLAKMERSLANQVFSAQSTNFGMISNANEQINNPLQQVNSSVVDAEFPSYMPENGKMVRGFWQPEIDQSYLDKDYTASFMSFNSEANINNDSFLINEEGGPFSHQYYENAVSNLKTAIDLKPINPSAYLERSAAYLGLGNYENFLSDFHQFSILTSKADLLSTLQFAKGFAKGFPSGFNDSTIGLFHLAVDSFKDPIHTGYQVYKAFSQLSTLVSSGQWAVLGEALAPEVRDLVKDWRNLSSSKRGELAGYAFAKYGADFVLPGAAAKVAIKGFNGLKTLNAVHKGFKTAEKLLVAESMAALENGAAIAEVVEANQKIMAAGRELGMSAREMMQLKHAGKWNANLNNAFESMFKTPAMRESFEHFYKAEHFLEPYARKFMTEAQVRELIHQTGINTFPRPSGIPENFRVRVTKRGGGMEYIHPEHTHTSVRVMPGKPHSSFTYQQQPYVVQMKNGKVIDNVGNIVISEAPEAHIPLKNFIYKGE